MGSSSTKELHYFGWHLEELGKKLITPEAEQTLAMECRPALTLRPEFRTLPMLRHVPTNSFARGSLDESDNPNHISIPMCYLVNLMIAEDKGSVRATLRRFLALRRYIHGNFFAPYGTTPVAGRSSSRRANHDRA